MLLSIPNIQTPGADRVMGATALTQNNVLHRSLHPILKELGISKTGFHAFRRFRDTHLENYTSCPNGLRKFWLAWDGSSELKSMSDRMSHRYNKIRENLTFRLAAAEKAGVGFVVPVSVRPMRSRKIVRKETGIAAQVMVTVRIRVVDVTGFEPATPCLQSRCSPS